MASIPCGIGAVLLHAVLRAFGLGLAVAVAASLAAAVAATAWLAPRLPHLLDGALARSPPRAVSWMLLGVLAVLATGRMSTFMVDESRSDRALYSFDQFFVHHSCLTAYYQAARLQRRGVPNVYERTLYEGPNGEPKFIGRMTTDVYLYPPPFLLQPRLALLASGSFKTWRTVWFGVQGFVLLLALLSVAAWIGGENGVRVGLMSLVVWLSVPTLLTLQIGNFQLIAITVSVLAMLQLERGRTVLGSALLAAMIVSKIFPGLLLVFLAFQRRWRIVAWTTSFCVSFVLLAVAVLGTAPFAAFFTYHLPRLSSGAAFETLFTMPDVIACNHAVFGLVQKLGLLGVPGMSAKTAEVVSWLYGIALVGVAAYAARGARDNHSKALVWLVLLQLGALRSPFSPDVYAEFAPLWSLSLLLAGTALRGRKAMLFGVAVVLANPVIPTVPIMPVGWLLTISLIHQALFLGFYFWVIRSSVRTSGQVA